MTLADIPTATRRRLALRAEAAALLLRHVAEALDHARPGAEREAERLRGTKLECAGALDDFRRLTALEGPEQFYLLLSVGDIAEAQRTALRDSLATAEDCREWSEAWDAWAAEVDP